MFLELKITAARKNDALGSKRWSFGPKCRTRQTDTPVWRSRIGSQWSSESFPLAPASNDRRISSFHTCYEAQVARRVEAGEKHGIRMNLTSGVCLLFCAPMICSDLNHPRRHRFQTPQGFSRFVTGRPSSAKVRSVPSVPPCFSGRRPRNWYHSRRSVKGELRTLVELTCPLIQSRNGYPPSLYIWTFTRHLELRLPCSLISPCY